MTRESGTDKEKVIGYGDEIIASGHVKKMYEGTPIMLLDKFGRARLPVPKTETSVWMNNPKIATKVSRRYVQYTNGPSCRPYILGYNSKKKQWTWNEDYSVNDYVGEIMLTTREAKQKSGDYITIEPNINPRNTINKDWGIKNYQSVVDELSKHIEVVQLFKSGEVLNNVTIARPRTFRDAAGYINGAKFHIGTEGGLHHAAAALGKPAIVIFGGYISPRITGYDFHHNFGEDESCGSFKPCSHCREAMKRISADQIIKTAEGML